MREVIVINPNTKPLHDKIRTAAYCRVSSDSDEQLASFSSQVSEYTNRISKNPDWVMVDIYADAPVIIGLKTLRHETCWKRGAF